MLVCQCKTGLEDADLLKRMEMKREMLMLTKRTDFARRQKKNLVPECLKVLDADCKELKVKFALHLKNEACEDSKISSEGKRLATTYGPKAGLSRLLSTICY